MADGQSCSPLADLHSVHTRIAWTMEKLDAAFIRVHKLGIARRLSSEELRMFISSMEGMEAELQKWAPLLTEAEARTPFPLPRVQLQNPPLITPSPSPATLLTPGGMDDPFSTPLTDGFSRGMLDTATPNVNTPQSYRTPPLEQDSADETMGDGGDIHVAGVASEGKLSPLPPTPSMTSPPRSCYVLHDRGSNASSGSFSVSPSSASPRTPLVNSRGPLSALGHNQMAQNLHNGMMLQGLSSKGEGPGVLGGSRGTENRSPAVLGSNVRQERLPDHAPSHKWAQASLRRTHSLGGLPTGPAPSPFRTPGVSRLMRLSPSGPSPVSPVQNLSFDSPATWQKKGWPRASKSPNGSPDLRTPQMDSPPATIQLAKIDGPRFEAMSPRMRRTHSGAQPADDIVFRTLSDTERLRQVEEMLRAGLGQEPVNRFSPESGNPFDSEPVNRFGRQPGNAFSPEPLNRFNPQPVNQFSPGPVNPFSPEPVNPFDRPENFASVGDLGLEDHSPSKRPAHPMEWVGRKTVDVAEVMRVDDVAACEWKDGLADLRDLHVSKSATLPRGIDRLEVDVRPDFEPLDGGAALLKQKGFAKQGLAANLEMEFGVEGSPDWMDGRAALTAYGLDSFEGPRVRTARLVKPGTKPFGLSPLKQSPVGSPERTWQEAKLETVEDWVSETAGGLVTPKGKETPPHFLRRWGGGESGGNSHRRSRSHDLGVNGTPRSDLGFLSPRVQKREWTASNSKGAPRDESDLINDGKENINPNVGAAAPAPPALNLAAFPPVFQNGEGAQQLLTVFQQFPPPQDGGSETPARTATSLSLSDLDGLLVGYGTERLSLLLDLLASRGAIQPSVVGRQMRWERTT